MRDKVTAIRARITERVTLHHQRFLTDLAIAGLLLAGVGCFWFSVGRWLALGALLMFAPKLFTDAGRLLDVELLRDRLGMQPAARPGKHSGKHPRPGARNRG